MINRVKLPKNWSKQSILAFLSKKDDAEGRKMLQFIEPMQANLREFETERERTLAVRSNWYCTCCGNKLPEQCPRDTDDGGFYIPTCGKECSDLLWKRLEDPRPIPFGGDRTGDAAFRTETEPLA